MTIEIEIDREACRGEKACVRRAPRTFSLGRDGKAVVAAEPGDDESKIRDAVQACPHFALSLRQPGS